MRSCELEFEITGPDAANHTLRVWVDDATSGGFESEHELYLQQRDGRWSASFGAPTADDACIWLRLAFTGNPGSTWHLTVRRDDDGEVLFSDGDTLALPKEWLVATCPIPSQPVADTSA